MEVLSFQEKIKAKQKFSLYGVDFNLPEGN
jgi:hypothetical protein